MSVPLVLPRFSGSTLEPTSEPIVMYPMHIHQKQPILFNKPANIELTRPTSSLQRKNRPTFIHIPLQCKEFIPKEPEDDDFSAWSHDGEPEPEFLWDEENQTIYKPSHRRPTSNSSTSSVDSYFSLPMSH
ncbi:hypothetical protein BJV82DRAFT_672733 [Fennellomyces sp. T-0311]|nr:hypothetical protein BJV82DRAFT_672733 [Fennellomyces sp. T-0311]